MIRILSLVILGVLCLTDLASQDRENYIRKYRHLAISEMQRSGIPASIKMAQAMLESNCGMSDLACQANNHFGIKCGGSWTGKSMHKKDDDYRDGELVASCFREFGSTEECFVAHSDFLTDPKKSYRYGFLFSLEPTDYKAWAHGLKKAGYATEPAYADRLISLIEKYELYLLDDIDTGDVIAFSGKKPTVNIRIKEVNGVKYIEVGSGENLKTISDKHKLSKSNLYKWNDEEYAIGELLDDDTRIFIESKKSSYKGKKKTHTVARGESLHDIAQLYGVKLESLRKRNKLHKNDEPAQGEKIVLIGKSDKPVRTVKQQPPAKKQLPMPVPEEGDPYELPDAVASTNTNSHPVSSTSSKPNTTVKTEIAAVKPPVTKSSITPKEGMTYQVSKGDTLYSIARGHGLSVDDLKKKNNLTADTISIGQNLIVK